MSVHRSSHAAPGEGSYGLDHGAPRRLLWLADIISVVLAFPVAYAIFPIAQRLIANSGVLTETTLTWLAVPLSETGVLPEFLVVMWPVPLMIPAVLVALQLLGGYQPLHGQSRTRIAVSSFAGPVLGLALVTMVLYALKSTAVSRLFLFTATGVLGATLLLYRGLMAAYTRGQLDSGRYAKNVVIVGDDENVRQVTNHFRRHVSETHYKILGYFRPLGASPSESADVPMACLGDVQGLASLLVTQPVHDVVVAQSEKADIGLETVMEAADYYRLTVHLVPAALLNLELKDLQLASRSQLGLPEIVLWPRGLDSDALFLKRLFDVFLSGAALVFLSPVFLIVALAIKLTTPRLPVFYPWRVIGYKGQPFTGYKFTTMGADADERRAGLADQNEMSGPVFKIKNDPRMTPLGAFLRKYSLNELPQLWSVFIGDMSLVGPRPAFRHELERYELWHKRKLTVKPGITCLWQVRGRNAISNFDDWARMDLEYIDNWNLWLDMKILWWTTIAVVRGTGS